jgi:hypothetical protein
MTNLYPSPGNVEPAKPELEMQRDVSEALDKVKQHLAEAIATLEKRCGYLLTKTHGVPRLQLADDLEREVWNALCAVREARRRISQF